MIVSANKQLTFNQLYSNQIALQSGRRAYFFFLKMIYGEVTQAKEITGHKKNWKNRELALKINLMTAKQFTLIH